jgi:hypothetical protein
MRQEDRETQAVSINVAPVVEQLADRSPHRVPSGSSLGLVEGVLRLAVDVSHERPELSSVLRRSPTVGNANYFLLPAD